VLPGDSRVVELQLAHGQVVVGGAAARRQRDRPPKAGGGLRQMTRGILVDAQVGPDLRVARVERQRFSMLGDCLG